MHFTKAWLFALGLSSLVAAPALADNVKLEGTRFTMDVPSGWGPGYKDLENLFMIYFKDAKSGAVLEGVYLRGAQPASFTLADFKKARIDSENKRYDGKGHKVAKAGDITIGGDKGNYLETTWADGGKTFVKYTAQHLKDGERYLVVVAGEKGKVDKAVFDHAVKTFALTKK
jgi:hypothetical protein